MAYKVLVVDDASVIRMRLKDILLAQGYHVDEATDGQDAIEKFQAIRPDVVTMDCTMPRKDGLQALEEIMAFDQNAKIIMITAINEKQSIMKAARLGASDYIIKPFKVERVLGAVQAALDRG